MSSSSFMNFEKKLLEVHYEDMCPQSPPSSVEPPMEEWTSLIFEVIQENPKITLYNKGLYDPGSGEICAQRLFMSDSDIVKNLYYKYPAVVDPGILMALQKPESLVIYPEDGQDLYLAVCEQMNVMPVRHFHRGLLKPTIDLKYYGINPNAMRSMTMALANNKIVTRLDLTSNYLNDDACYHIGAMLKENNTLQELILSECKIRTSGMLRVAANLPYRPLDLLDLSSNDLRDVGFKHLADALSKGAVIKRLNLRNNSLTGESGLAFAAAIQFQNKITHLDLSWNNMFHPKGMFKSKLLHGLSMSNVLVELNMSWNSLTTGAMLQELLDVKTLCVLDLSNNRLSEAAAKAIAPKLYKAKKLNILDLSNNPFTPAQAFLIMSKLERKTVKLENLIMKNVYVTKDFVETEEAYASNIIFGRLDVFQISASASLESCISFNYGTNIDKLEKILQLPHRKNTSVVHGDVLSDYTPSKPDIRTIIMKRLRYLTEASKKCKLDIAGYFLQELKTHEFLLPKAMLIAMRLAKAPVGEELIDEVANAFPGPKRDGAKSINLKGVAEYIERLWPDAKCPPTPPPESEPEPIQPQNKKGVKEAKGKKK